MFFVIQLVRPTLTLLKKNMDMNTKAETATTGRSNGIPRRRMMTALPSQRE